MNFGDGLTVGILGVVVAVLLLAVGYTLGSFDIGTDCQQLGKTHIGSHVYVCAEETKK